MLYSELLTGAQMILGVAYSIFILTIAIQRFAEPENNDSLRSGMKILSPNEAQLFHGGLFHRCFLYFESQYKYGRKQFWKQFVPKFWKSMLWICLAVSLAKIVLYNILYGYNLNTNLKV